MIRALARTLAFLVAGLVWVGAAAQDPEADYSSVLIEPGESIESIVDKAARVTPAPRQVAWQELEFTAFIHFGMNTFTDREWGTGEETPEQFAPTAFDARQWVRAFKSAGMRGVVLTAKHHDGFCLWQTETTAHSIKHSPWRGGKGDVVRDVAEACRAEGLAFGVYLSPWDRNTKVFGTPGYNRVFQQQLRELLTRYGDVVDVWFDGAHAPRDRPEIFDWSGHYRLIRELQPDACISVMGPDVRWCGNEAGRTRASEWNVVPIDSGDARPASRSQETTEAIVKRFKDQPQDLGSRAKLRSARQLVWRPAMTNTSIRPGWFYHASQDGKVRSLEELLDIYYGSVGGNTQFLLNVPPDRRGLVHENDVERLRQIGRVLRATFETDLVAGARATATATRGGDGVHAADKTVDGDSATYWTTDEGVTAAAIEYDLGEPKTFNVAMLQERIRVGQRVEAFTVDVETGGEWTPVASATTIGYKRLLRFDTRTARRVRVRITSSRVCPTLSRFGLFRAPGIIAQPEIRRDRAGSVSITAPDGVEVRYTLDGTEPGPDSKRYVRPFPLPRGGRVRALAIPGAGALDLGGSRLCEREFGISKGKWRVVAVDSEEPGARNEAIRAIDDDPATFWHTQWQRSNPGYPHEMVIDLGETVELAGLTYLPRQDGADGGLVAKYEVWVSPDGKAWGAAPAAKGEFGNVLNNPVQQRAEFARPRRARFIRFVALASPNGKPWAGAAELGVWLAR